MSSILRVLGWGVVVGFAGFVLGFFGPMVLAPGANQGPLLGIFITGPLGFLAGLGFGIYKELAPKITARPTIAQILAHPATRFVVGLVGAWLLLEGFAGLGRDASRGAAAAILLGIAAGYIAATGRSPSWFRR